MVKTVSATRYITPLREGGSLPAVMEADDGVLYVCKFVGAGQGYKALIAELIAGEIGRALGLAVPELALIELDPELAPSEPDPEIYDLLRMSAGLNLGLRYLPNAYMYTNASRPEPDADLASAIVWFDSYVTNVDRTPRNSNILIWNKGLWLIDHGACLYFHHDWRDYEVRSRTPFPPIKDHVLLSLATKLGEADARMRAKLSPALLREVVQEIPEVWLKRDTHFETPEARRDAYVQFLLNRLEAAPLFVQEAQDARKKRV